MITANEAYFFAAFILIILVLAAVIRIFSSKNIPEQVVALDVMNTLIVCILILLSAAFDTIICVDIAIVYALLSYVSTLYIAQYLEKHPRGAKK